MSENKCYYWVQGLLIGGLIGAITGMLLAPRSGKETVEELSAKAKEIATELKEFAANLEENKIAHDELMDRLKKLEAQEGK